MTKTVTIDDAQNKFLELVSFTSEGNEVLIIKDEKPLARLVPPSLNEQLRIAGLNKGKIWASEDFDDPLPDEFWSNSQ